MKNSLEIFEDGFTISSIILYSSAVLVLLLSGGQQEYESVDFDALPIRLAFFVSYAITFGLLVLRWRKTLTALQQNHWIFPLVIFSVVSILWSFEQSTTVKDSFTMVGSTLFGLYLGCRYSLHRQLELLGWALGIIVILSFVFVIALPKYGIMGGVHQGKWRGVFNHKNGLGQSMVYAALIFLFLAYQNQRYKFWMWMGLGLSTLLLLLSTSTASMFNLLILVSIFFAIYIFRFPYTLMIPVIALIAIIGELLYFLTSDNAGTIFTSVGKDTTLTGRTELWSLAVEMIWQQPILGYGLGGFWQGLNGVGSGYIWRAVDWTPSHPHNGYLELLLDLGLVGACLFAYGFIPTLIKAFKILRMTKTVDVLWPIVHMAQLLVTSTTESQLFESNNLGWLLYVAAAFASRTSLDIANGQRQTKSTGY